jgi:Rrf2 family protein
VLLFAERVKLMKISSRGRHSVKVMFDIATNENSGYVSISEISERLGITAKYLEQITSKLCKAGFLKSLRGAGGGYMLSKKPSSYKVGDILRATEGSLSPVECVAGSCKGSSCCATFSLWVGLDNTINSYLDSLTLQDIINNKS